MRRIYWLLVLVLVMGGVLAVPAFAQDMTQNAVSFNGFSFTFPSSVATNVAISQYPGDPTTLEQPGGPDPRHTEFRLSADATVPQSTYEGAGGIRVYNTAELNGYEFPTREYQMLQTLLAQRPDLTSYLTPNLNDNSSNLPFLPVAPAAQVIRARVQYVDLPSVQGVSYVTVYRQDVSPFVGSEFIYTFQGLSADGAFYVSAQFPLNTGLFPAEIPTDFDYDTFNQQFGDYLTQSVATLHSAAPEDFTPSLATLDAIVQSFSFGAAGAPPPAGATQIAPATPLPAASPTAVGDPTMGGLAGMTWTLVSYGSADNPQPALTGVPVTINFSPTGVNGSTGCNSYTGNFQYENNTLLISSVITTLIACDQPIMDQETAFLNALQTATSFQLSGSTLLINYDGGSLTLTSAPPPAATEAVSG